MIALLHRRCIFLIAAILVVQCERRTVTSVVANRSFAPRDGVPATDTAARADGTTTGTAAGTTRLFLRNELSAGRYVADEGGRALYTASADTPVSSTCNGRCVDEWIPVSPPAEAAMSGIDGHRIGVITRADGIRQVTYGGAPVYRYARDRVAGDVNGNGRRDFGSVWSVLRP